MNLHHTFFKGFIVGVFLYASNFNSDKELMTSKNCRFLEKGNIYTYADFTIKWGYSVLVWL